jgi:large subunit ribosomal protein L5
MGVGRAVENRKVLDAVAKDLSMVTGQKPLLTRAKKSVSGFKLRQGMPIGCVVTLRGRRMYEFMDRLVSVVIPRIRDFRGLNPEGFDGRGNYNMGITEQIVFPEIRIDEVEFVQGMNVTFAIRGGSDEESLELLRMFGMPFRR